MDPLLRTSLIIFAVVAIKAVLLSQWTKFKERHAAHPTPTRLERGVYRPWGAVEKIRHYGWRLTQIWLACIAVLLCMLAYSAVTGASIL